MFSWHRKKSTKIIQILCNQFLITIKIFLYLLDNTKLESVLFIFFSRKLKHFEYFVSENTPEKCLLERAKTTTQRWVWLFVSFFKLFRYEAILNEREKCVTTRRTQDVGHFSNPSNHVLTFVVTFSRTIWIYSFFLIWNFPPYVEFENSERMNYE